MPGKLPYFPFYGGDWLKDDALTLCAPATRGVWIDLIARMHERDRSGELRGTAEQLSRAARCSTVEFESAATDLQATGTAEVEQRNGVYVVRNRRMYAECAQRKAASERQLRYRNAVSNGANTGATEYESEDEFEEFWKAYPAGRKKSKGKAREAFSKALAKVPATTLLEAARQYAASDEGRGKYVKMPTTWLNGECWNDDRAAWRDLDSKQPSVVASEYRQVELRVFNQAAKQKEFLSGPFKDGNRVYGQLKSKAKIESNTEPGWKPS